MPLATLPEVRRLLPAADIARSWRRPMADTRHQRDTGNATWLLLLLEQRRYGDRSRNWTERSATGRRAPL